MAMAVRHSFRYFDHLKEAGVPEEQARAIIETIEDSGDSSLKDLTTKSNLALVKTDLASVKTDLALAKVELKAEISELRTDINWLKRLFMGGLLMIIINININIVMPLLHHS